MSPVLSSPRPTKYSASRHRLPIRSRSAATCVPTCGEVHLGIGPLVRYLDPEGRARELIALPGHGGSVLLLDRDAATLRDRRLVAHLAADEPRSNAELVCRHYLADVNGRWCRRVSREDLELSPFAEKHGDPQGSKRGQHEHETHIEDQVGNTYRLALPPGERPVLQMRWSRRASEADTSCWEQASLREVVGAVENYEPACTVTKHAFALHDEDPCVSLTRLRCEFNRLLASPVVLNRGLREAVLRAIQRGDTSMSEIALRCGVVKRDRRGKVSGETSWLARRIGIMPEGGETTITPWIHSDVLATIAREGLGVSPREVELQ
jgi:hypothetical protein